MSKLTLTNEGVEITEIDLIDNHMIVIHPGKDGMITNYHGQKFYLDSSNILDQSYVKIIKALRAKYPNFLSSVVPDRIAVVIDQKFVNTEKTTVNSGWYIDIKRATAVFGKYASNLFNMDYVVQLRSFWLKEWTPAQVHAAILSQLLRIDQQSGAIVANKEPHSSKCVATFGRNYLDPGIAIDDVLKVVVELKEFATAKPAQVSIDEVKPVAELESDDDLPFGDLDVLDDPDDAVDSFLAGVAIPEEEEEAAAKRPRPRKVK